MLLPTEAVMWCQSSVLKYQKCADLPTKVLTGLCAISLSSPGNGSNRYDYKSLVIIDQT